MRLCRVFFMLFLWTMAFPVTAAPLVAREPLRPKVVPAPARGVPLAHELARALSPRPPEIVEDGAVDLLHTELDVRIMPNGRTVEASVIYTIRTNRQVGNAFLLWLDQGLEFQTASCDGEYNIIVQTTPYPPFMYATIRFSPMTEENEVLRVHLTYSGTLQCAPYGARGAAYCGSGEGLSYYQVGGPFPIFMDAMNYYGHVLYDLDLTLRTPENLDLLVAADPVDGTVEEGVRITRWEGSPYTSGMNLILLTGSFDSVPLEDTDPPSSVWHLADSPEWVSEMAAWSSTIFHYLDEQSGRKLPFGEVAVFKLPWMAGFPGTATWGTVYLAETYAQGGEEWFEEILAHEISHLWWGPLAYQVDLQRNNLMTEGMAMTSQYDYIWRKYYPDVDPDVYFLGKLRQNQLYLWYLTDPETLPDIQMGIGEEWPDTINEQVVWAYYKTSAFLDLLRMTIGEEAFFGALKDYLDVCVNSQCDIRDFEQVFTERAGSIVTSLFETFVYKTTYAELTLGIQLCPAAAGTCDTTVSLSHDTDIDLPVQVFLYFADGTFEKKSVELTDPSQDFVFTTDDPVVSVQVNPRSQVFYRVSPASPGDVNGDGETDGFDLIATVFHFGRRAVADVASPGLYDVDMLFDARYDVNRDGVIDSQDVAIIGEGFGIPGGGDK